ncbi:MAG: hypothetical protein ABR987_12705 [Terracidiphilus sp.]|jgi:hypothetical protein
MKQQLWLAAATCVISLVLTFAFNALSKHAEGTDGRVLVGEPVKVSGTLFTEIQVENWGNKSLDGLILVVPASVQISSITTSYPLSIEEQKGYSGSDSLKRLTISEIPPKHLTRIMIPLSSPDEIDRFRLPSLGALKLESEWSAYAVDPAIRYLNATIFFSVLNSLQVGVLTFVVLAIVNAYYNKRSARLQSTIDEHVEKIKRVLSRDEEAKKDIAELRKQFASLESRAAKQRFYLLARISDYSRELDFWRDTMRGILLGGGFQKQPVEAVIAGVTKSLKTYGTMVGDTDFKAVVHMAGLLTEPDQKGRAFAERFQNNPQAAEPAPQSPDDEPPARATESPHRN